MGMGTSTGKYYPTEVEYALHEGMEHYMLDDIFPGEKYDDSPTLGAHIREKNNIFDELKQEETNMEYMNENRKYSSENIELSKSQEISYKGKLPGVEIREGSGGGYKPAPPPANMNKKSEDLGLGGLTKDQMDYGWALLKQRNEQKADMADKLLKQLDKLFPTVKPVK